MAWTLPTAAQVKAAVPALTDVPDASVEASLAMASAEVGQFYPSQVVYDRAVQLYTAHDLTVQGLGSSPEAEMAQTGSLQSVSDGAVSFTRKSAGNGSDDPMMLTTFGSRYRDLARRYRVPFTVAQETTP